MSSVILYMCLYLLGVSLTHFKMFSNGINTLQLRLTEIAKVRRVLMQRNELNFPMLLIARVVFLNIVSLKAYSNHTMHVRMTILFIFEFWLLPKLLCVSFSHM